MAARPYQTPHRVITNGNMNADITSQVTIIDNKSMVGYSLSWTGSSPIGVVKVQVSNDFSIDSAGSVLNAGTWTDLTLDPEPAVSGNTGTGFIDIGATSAYVIRLFYDRTSGTGTLNVFVTSKVL